MVRFYQIELSNLSLCKRQFRKDKDGKKIFREKIMERVSSPEQLEDYIGVTSPGMWMVMGAVVLLLAGVCVWGIFGRLDTVIKAPAVVKDGTITYSKP